MEEKRDRQKLKKQIWLELVKDWPWRLRGPVGMCPLWCEGGKRIWAASPSLLWSHSSQRYSSAPPWWHSKSRWFPPQSQVWMGIQAKIFLLPLWTLLCLALELFVFAEWTWPSVTINPTMKKRCFCFSQCHYVLLGWHLRERKKAESNNTQHQGWKSRGEASIPHTFLQLAT